MQFRSLLFTAIPALLLANPAQALKIDLRYDYDTQGFFNQPGAKEAMRKVADTYEALIHDSLSAIDPAAFPGSSWSAKFTHPGNGTQITVPGLVVPADTIIVFAGGRSLGGPAGIGGQGGFNASGVQEWGNLLNSRGEPGALASPKTDFGPWGGAITFDPGLAWNFSTTASAQGKLPFVSIALHEIGHVLGIGGAGSWQAKIVVHEDFAEFTGSHSAQANGGNVLLYDGSHWSGYDFCVPAEDIDPDDSTFTLSKTYGSFGTTHGQQQLALMEPIICSEEVSLKVLTDLDIAALRDIGWEVEQPAKWLTATYDPATSPFSFSWPSLTGFSYRVESSSTLTGAWSPLTTRAGDGSIQQFTTPAPGTEKIFYRLSIEAPAAGATLKQLSSAPVSFSQDEVIAEGCQCSPAWLVK